MKFFSHSIHRKVQVVLCGLLFCAYLPASFAANHTANVQSIRLVPDEHGATIEIKADQPITPQITPLDLPHRLVIDLPYAVTSHQGKRVASHVKQITDIRFGQYTVKPPVVRIVVDLSEAMTYRVEAAGNQLLVHLLSAEHAPPTVPALAREEQPAAVPVSSATSGGVMMDAARLAAGSAITAGSETAILHLARGGEVKVCAGTTISVTSSKSGEELMLGVSTGAIEGHYSLGAAADSVVTPDFRLVLAGPGEFDYAMSVNAHGDTCIRTMNGNTAPLTVSELIGDGNYRVRPDEQVVFHSGQLANRDANVPLTCGCSESRPETLRASESNPQQVTAPVNDAALPSAVRLAPQGSSASGSVAGAPDSTNIPASEPTTSAEAAVPAPTGANDVHVQVEAPLVFQGRATPAPQAEAAPEREVAALPATPPATQPAAPPSLPATVALPPAKKEHRGFFGGIGHFFKSIFG
ncbi:MAG TPA: AMIN domain-containing protein [Terriglobales bacterium]|jgi:hypothetical protein